MLTQYRMTRRVQYSPRIGIRSRQGYDVVAHDVTEAQQVMEKYFPEDGPLSAFEADLASSRPAKIAQRTVWLY